MKAVMPPEDDFYHHILSHTLPTGCRGTTGSCWVLTSCIYIWWHFIAQRVWPRSSKFECILITWTWWLHTRILETRWACTSQLAVSADFCIWSFVSDLPWSTNRLVVTYTKENQQLIGRSNTINLSTNLHLQVICHTCALKS